MRLDQEVIVMIGAEIVGGVDRVDDTLAKLTISSWIGVPAERSGVVAFNTRSLVDSVDSDCCCRTPLIYTLK